MARRIGSLWTTSFVGQDPRRKAEIEQQLFKDFDPKDVIEEIWLSEIATLTVTLEYFRQLEVSINYGLLERRQVSEMLDKEEAIALRLGDTWDPQGDRLRTQSYQRAMSQMHPRELKVIGDLIEIMNKLRRDRDRIFNQLERKRRPALMRAVKYTEVEEKTDKTKRKLTD